MKISAIQSFPYLRSKSNIIISKQNQEKINQTKQEYLTYAYKPNFGNRIYQDFNIEQLPNIGIDQEFSNNELVPINGSVNLTSILGMTYSSAEPIRYFEKHGELIPYKRNLILEECQYKGLSEEETQHKLDNAKIDFKNEVKKQKEDAIATINSLSPTEKEHTVYRVISAGWTQDSNDYFEQMSKLKKGEQVVLDTTPIYVSTSARKTIGNYGGKKDYILFKINLPKGSKLLRFPSSDGIEQGIMKPDAKFRVVDNEEYNNNFHYITLDYLPTEEG